MQEEYMVILERDNQRYQHYQRYLVLAESFDDAKSQVLAIFELENEEIKRYNEEIGYCADNIYTESDFKAIKIETLHKDFGKVLILY